MKLYKIITSEDNGEDNGEERGSCVILFLGSDNLDVYVVPDELVEGEQFCFLSSDKLERPDIFTIDDVGRFTGELFMLCSESRSTDVLGGKGRVERSSPGCDKRTQKMREGSLKCWIIIHIV